VEVLPEQPTAKGPAEWFTGDVWIDSITRGEEPSRVRVSAVRFTPAARTAWHSHAVGQTLYVTEGRGRLQSRGGDIAEIRPGSARSPGRARPSRRSPRPGSTASRRGTRST
jgi:quercetin dioxygenase-like cupin family protein